MGIVLSDVVSATLADPLFTEQDCRDLDQEVGRKARDLKGSAWLGDAEILKLQANLNSIASGWAAQDVVNQAKPTVRIERLEAIRETCDDLMRLLGIGPRSSSWNILLEHLIEDGIFEDETVDYELLVSLLQTLSRVAAGTAHRLEVRPHTKVVLADYRLVDDLGGVYIDLWGRGRLQVSVNNGKGGPSVRFFVFTLSKIVGHRILAQRVLDAVRKIKSGKVDLSEVYSPVMPHGGSRISPRKD
jgi:hypothetical protein